MEHAMAIGRFVAATALLGTLAMPGLASAQTTAFAVAGTTNMRAGPDAQYPVIAKILDMVRCTDTARCTAF